MPIQQASICLVSNLFFQNSEVIPINEMVDDTKSDSLVKIGVPITLEVHIQSNRKKAVNGLVSLFFYLSVAKLLQIKKDRSLIEENSACPERMGMILLS